MKIILNGGAQEIPEQTVLSEMLNVLGYQTQFIAVAINFTCIRRQEFETTPLCENDQVEVLSPAAGG
jgi:sulfur carrier protein